MDMGTNCILHNWIEEDRHVRLRQDLELQS